MNRMAGWLLFFLLMVNVCPVHGLEWVRVTDDQRGFVLAESGRRFVPWGFNYDHDADGKLIEDYWDESWSEVESDFREMKGLGANIVRIHLQFGKFMASPTEPQPAALERLTQLVKLAEDTGLYINVTGLGCYHKPDVPPWYDTLDEAARWRSQAAFWRAIARRCAGSPAIFCYDLMNEPVVAGGDAKRDDWLGPGFAGKHFVQFITLERAGRERQEVAKQWIHQLVAAIREHDQRHLITVGLVPWSLDRPGLTSGFVPAKIAGELDFLAVHLYPEQGKVEESLSVLRDFAAVGKPVVIEEIFPLKCDMKEFESFLIGSQPYASGWIGFYWGQAPAELAEIKTIPAAITLSWLKLFQDWTPTITSIVPDRSPRTKSFP